MRQNDVIANYGSSMQFLELLNKFDSIDYGRLTNKLQQNVWGLSCMKNQGLYTDLDYVDNNLAPNDYNTELEEAIMRAGYPG